MSLRENERIKMLHTMNKQDTFSRIINFKLAKTVIVLTALLLVSCNGGNNLNKFYIANSTYDFGNTKGNEILETTFIIKNLFDVPIKIIDIKSSCKCVKTTHSKTILKPNEVMEMHVEFNTKGFKGVQKKSISIETDNANNKYLRFSVQTKIID